mgnify:CR=1 FL=1
MVYRKIQVRLISQAIACQSNNSVSKLLSALCTTTCKNLAAVSVRHSLAETVDLLAVQLLGLIGTFRCHVETPPVRIAALLRAALTRHRLKGGAVNRSRPHDRGATDIIQTV